MSNTKVFVLDDHQLIREAIANLLDNHDDLELVGEAATAAEGLEEIIRLEPDVVVLDVRLPDGDGLQLCREIRSSHPDVRWLVFTGTEDSLADAVLAGASGYMTKGLGGAQVVDAVRRVAAGESIVAGVSPKAMVERLRERRVPALTRQEGRVLDLIGRGLTNKQIATELTLAEQTVKNYVSSVLSKLGLQRRTQAAIYAARRHQEGGVEGLGDPTASS